jgi:hypothetical protein
MPKASDSIVSAQARGARIREEAEQLEREQAQAAEKQQDHQAKLDEIARQQEVTGIEIVSAGETREHLLQRVRDMRNKGPAVPAPEGYRSPNQLAEFNAEQELGRAGVAKAEREQEMYRERRQLEAVQQQAKEGYMTPVHHPNPSQDQVYPTSKATLPGSK